MESVKRDGAATGVAALQKGKRVIEFEASRDYFEVAAKRLRRHQ
jgi:hypothetical protein